MPLPKSIIKYKNGNVEYKSNLDATKYSMEELERAAMKDVAKLVRTVAKDGVAVHTGNLKSNIATWVRKSRITNEVSMQIGVYTNAQSLKKGKTPAYHSHLLEFGTKKMKAQPYLRPSVYERIEDILRITSKYLGHLSEDDINRLLDENEEVADD